MEWQKNVVVGIFLQTLQVVFLPYEFHVRNQLCWFLSDWQWAVTGHVLEFSRWVDRHHLPPFLRWLSVSYCPGGKITLYSVPLCVGCQQVLWWEVSACISLPKRAARKHAAPWEPGYYCIGLEGRGNKTTDSAAGRAALGRPGSGWPKITCFA